MSEHITIPITNHCKALDTESKRNRIFESLGHAVEKLIRAEIESGYDSLYIYPFSLDTVQEDNITCPYGEKLVTGTILDDVSKKPAKTPYTVSIKCNGCKFNQRGVDTTVWAYPDPEQSDYSLVT